MPVPDRDSGIDGFRYRVFDGRLDSARADKETLLLALQAVTSTADEMEKELTGKDAL